tara:strand:- start:10516 stop:11004 length:489 start_codon:yes stop_codon:yes gene_type:complete
MIEIGLALAAASKAFELIQQGVQTGQDATDLIGKLGSFYDAKDKVQEAKQELERRPASGAYASGSVENYALKVVEAEMKIAKYEEQVKKIFMAKGKTPLYQRMMRIREEERHRRAQEAIKRNRERREKLRKEQELKNLMFAVIAAALCVGGAGWIIAFIGSL